MVRLIDADKLDDYKFRSASERMDLSVDYMSGWNDAIYHIEANSPTVDAVPVRHGKWVQRFIEIGGQKFGHGMQCSVCAEPALDNEGDDYLTEYCPFCGAKMDAERKEE